MNRRGEENDTVEVTWKLPDNFAIEMLKKLREICRVKDVSRYFDYYKIIVSFMKPLLVVYHQI